MATLKFRLLGCLLVGLSGLPALAGYGEIKEYQIGNEWGKRRVWRQDLEGHTAGYQRAAMATAYLTSGGATGFYLGQFGGLAVVATNHHVCPVVKDCLPGIAEFRLLGIRAKITHFLVTIKSLDLTLLAIETKTNSDLAKLNRVAANFEFRRPVLQGQMLATFGFGVAGNPQNYLVGNADSDCRVFSKTGDVRKMGDPDPFNPVAYSAWSFVHGCDISHGDSGSALVDRHNGQVMGILWTGKFPKSKWAQNSSNLDVWLKTSNEAVWKELNYAVPATAMLPLLQKALTAGGVSREAKQAIAELIQ
jgi:hypothetical protein